MKFPNFLMNTSFSARAFVLIVALLLLSAAGFAQISREAATTLDIEQCANGPLSAPIHCNVSNGNDGYTRGNLVSSKSHYLEGDSVPIRIISTNLVPTTSYMVTIGYDYTKGGKYATDYLTTYDRTEMDVNDPCVAVVPCDPNTATTFGIPLDPQVALGFDGLPGGDDITQIPGVFTCFGCHITAASDYTLTGSTSGDSTKTIKLTFTADSSSIVIAYGSHISTRADWGLDNSAINISGSPYHNFIAGTTIPANSGNRDLQLSAEAVIFPASVTVVKLVDNSDMTYSNNFEAFGFTSTNFVSPSNFTLTDTDPAQFGGASVSRSDYVLFGSANSVTVTENAPINGYSLSNLQCSITSGSGATTGTATGNLGTRTGTIVLEEGNQAICTFTNTRAGVTAAPASVTGRVVSLDGMPISGISLRLTDISTGEVRTATTSSFGYYTFTDLTVQDFYQLTITAKRYRFSNPTVTFTLTEDLAGLNFFCTSQ